VGTEQPGSGIELARRAVECGADLVVAAGGDGTLNEVFNGLVGSEVPLAVLPAGTANVLATELGLGSLEQAASRLSQWVPKRVAAGLLTSGGSATPRYFLSMAGVGLDARIVHGVDPNLKKQAGKLSYWVAGFRQLGRRLAEFEVCADGWRRRCSFALASRVRDYGGTFRIARHASLFRDDFAVVLFEGRNTVRYLKYLAGVLMRRLEAMRGVTLLHARRIRFESAGPEPVWVQVDGEPAGLLPATAEAIPDAVTLLVPPEFPG
jgi:diacylglycerol kinase family enzyme